MLGTSWQDQVFYDRFLFAAALRVLYLPLASGTAALAILCFSTIMIAVPCLEIQATI